MIALEKYFKAIFKLSIFYILNFFEVANTTAGDLF